MFTLHHCILQVTLSSKVQICHKIHNCTRWLKFRKSLKFVQLFIQPIFCTQCPWVHRDLLAMSNYKTASLQWHTKCWSFKWPSAAVSSLSFEIIQQDHHAEAQCELQQPVPHNMFPMLMGTFVTMCDKNHLYCMQVVNSLVKTVTIFTTKSILLATEKFQHHYVSCKSVTLQWVLLFTPTTSIYYN